MEDVELVSQAQKGNRSAFESLIRSYSRLVWAAIYGMIDDTSYVEDLVQETFIRAWRSIGALRLKKNLGKVEYSL